MDGGTSPDTLQPNANPFYTRHPFHFPFSIRESDSPLAIVLILPQSPTQSFLSSVPTQRFLFSSFATPFTILLFPISNPFSVSLSFHSHSSFQNLSSLHCISLSSSSNLFSIIHTFHSHSSFQKPSSSHCISIQPFQSLLQHSHIHSLFPFPFSVYKPIMIAVSLFHDTNPFYTRRSFHSHSSFQNQSSSLCISLSRFSNPFSSSPTFHSHSHSSALSSSLCISIQPFQSLLQHSHIHFPTSFHLPLVIATLSRR